MTPSRTTRKAKFAQRFRRLMVEGLEDRRLMAWDPLGPFGATQGQVEGITNRPVIGAVQAILTHPTNPDVLYAATVNGGVWKTTNATAASPDWTPTTDTQSSQSMGSIAYDSADATFQTIYAGNNRRSSFGSVGTARDGLLKSTDGAATWTRVNGAGNTMGGKGISGIVANGNNIVLSVSIADSFTYGNIGIYRSSDGGATFSQVSGAGGSGLPQGICYDLTSEQGNPNVLYTSVAIPLVAGTQGVYKSTNGGATWARVSTPAMDALFTGNTSNAKVAAGVGSVIYFAINNSGVNTGIFRSADSGATWTQMDSPSTFENTGDVGLNPGGPKGPIDGTPEQVAGGQGSLHFSMVADATDPNIVYVGGDRQPRANRDTGGFPNSIGANDFTGRLFRGDASKPAGTQWVHLTHRNNLGAAGGGTANSTAPHADSRDMAIDANGNIIEGDDGGIYRRVNPKSNTGDWVSVIGTLQNTESHDVAWDSVSNVGMTGNQDTGTMIQTVTGATNWTSVSTADGGDVTIDELALAGTNQSIRYSSFQNAGGFTRRVYNSNGTLAATSFPSLTVTSGNAFTPSFRTPMATNKVVGGRLLVQGTNSLYESLNQGTSMVEIGASRGNGNSIQQDALVYGGRLNGVDNPDVIWAGSQSNIVFRNAPGAVALVTSPTGGNEVRDITVDPENYTSAIIVTANAVFRTTNSGTTWTNITGGLLSLTSDIRSVQYVPATIGAIVVGTARGVFATSLAELGVWAKVSTNLPNVLVYEMEYDAADNVLVAGTFGRGVWKLNNATAEVDIALPPFDYGDAPNTYPVTLAQNGARHVRLGPTLGTLRDAEIDGSPSSNALGDNSVGGADEDGVTFTNSAILGETLTVQINAPLGGFLSGWIDFDRNGTFDSTERVFNDQSLIAGVQSLNVPVPVTATSGTSYARFRLASVAGQANAPTGQAASGEVEDYQLQLFNNTISQGVFYRGSFYQTTGGVAGATDTTKSAIKAGSAAQTASFANVTNNAQGINGILLQVAGLTATALNASDFVFRMSPQGAFNEAANPPSSWANAPAPSNIVVTPASGGAPATVRVEWSNNAIENRWLQVIVKATTGTGLAANQAFYQGHLRGDIDGAVVGGAFTVLNADLVAALPVGGVGTVSSLRDVDRNGFVLNSDFVIIRNGINAALALRRITIPAANSGAEGRPADSASVAAPLIAGTSSLSTSSASINQGLPAVLKSTQAAIITGPGLTSPGQLISATGNQRGSVSASTSELKLKTKVVDEVFCNYF